MKNLTALRLLGRFISGYRRYFMVAILATGVNIILMFLTPQVLRFTVDGVIGAEVEALPTVVRFLYDLAPARALLFAALAIMACIVVSGVFGYFSRMGMARGAEGISKDLRDALFSHVQKLPFKWHTETLTGDIIQRCTSDTAVVHSFLANQLVEVFRILVLIITATALMFSMNVPLALLAFAFIPIIVIYSSRFYKRIASKFHKVDEAEGELMIRVQENLTGVRVVKAFGREAYELERFHEKNDAFAKVRVDMGYLLGVYWGVGDIVTGLQIIGVITLGTYLTVQGHMTLGELLAFSSYSGMLTWPARSLGRTLSEMSQTSVAATRLLEILDAEPEDAGEEDPTAPQPDLAGDIAFRHVTFAYKDNANSGEEAGEPPRGDTTVLRDLDFTIPKGTVFGILGGTGSGKSTITYLLTRLYDLAPENGEITIGGVNLQEIDRRYLRRHVGLVLQEPFLFSKTVGENIAIAKDRADLREIRRVARVADVDESIEGFSGGYDTIVGERGVTLSGGQKQRVAIARTLLIDAPIMIFDDSLSAVDMETDAKIQGALRENTGGATVILISHRVATLMHADQILVLDDGRQAELGNHKTLLEQGGIYSRVYKLQSEAGEGGAH